MRETANEIGRGIWDLDATPLGIGSPNPMHFRTYPAAKVKRGAIKEVQYDASHDLSTEQEYSESK